MRQTILAAPGVGMIHGTAGADGTMLSDRIANGEAYEGERLARLPRRLTATGHGCWLVERGYLEAAAQRSTR